MGTVYRRFHLWRRRYPHWTDPCNSEYLCSFINDCLHLLVCEEDILWSLKPELANNDKIRDPPLTMSIPLLTLAIISLILGVYPKPLLELLHKVLYVLI